MSTVNDPFQAAMLATLNYPNPPAGIAAILVNVGGHTPAVVHIDLHDGQERVFKFKDGELTYTSSDNGKTLRMVSPEDSLQPKELTDYDRVRTDQVVIEHLQRGNVISAIKRAREITRLGLKESKDLIDTIRRNDGY